MSGSSSWAATSAASGTGTAIPGIQCDNESYCYMPLLEELNYMPSKKFADGAEIYEHCQRIGRHFGLYETALFHTLVRASALGRGRSSAGGSAPIAATTSGPASWSWPPGRFNRPKLPGIPGIKRLQGAQLSTRRAGTMTIPAGTCTGGLDKLADKRVAIIGTGATGVQMRPLPRPVCQAPLCLPAHAVIVDERGNAPTDPGMGRNR